MINMENREIEKQLNAEENYMTTPISVLSYIRALEKQNKELLDNIDELKSELKDCTENYNYYVDKCFKLESELKDKERVNEWISVKDKLPNEENMYLVKSKKDYTAKFNTYGKFKDKFTNYDENGFDYEIYVTHWMPLPN